jgi:hypothetical protein
MHIARPGLSWPGEAHAVAVLSYSAGDLSGAHAAPSSEITSRLPAPRRAPPEGGEVA